ncbi:MAG: trigger factor [Thermomicrobiales bacterium]
MSDTERMYGREAFVEEANRDLIDVLFRKAIEQEKIVPVGDPELDSVEPDPLTFIVRVPRLSGRSIRVTISPCASSQLMRRWRSPQSTICSPKCRRRKARGSIRLHPAKPAEGDQVTVDIEIREGDEEFQPLNEDAQFIIGESNLLAELKTVIESLSVGDHARPTSHSLTMTIDTGTMIHDAGKQ